METKWKVVKGKQHVGELFTESVSVTLTYGTHLPQVDPEDEQEKATHNKMTQRWGRWPR